MKLFSLSTVASAAAAPALVAANGARSALYVFDPELAGGIGGTIKTTWDGTDGQVTIEADLDFNGVDADELAQLDESCVDQPTQYLWSIHTQWAGSGEGVSTSGAFEECDDEFTGKPYDSTQFGTLEPDEDGAVKLKWTEAEFASWEDQKPTWNIVIQAVCDKSAPAVACASGTIIEEKRRKHLRVAKRHVKGDEGDTGNPHYDPNYGSDERKHKSKAKRHAVKEDENNDQMFPARPDIFILPGNGKGDFGDSENPHYDPNYGSDERKHKSKAKRHAVKEDENNDQMFPARPDIFILPGNGKGDFGDSENPHYDPNYGSDERKHKSKAKRHAVKEDENNDQMFPARPDIFILPGNGKGDFGDSENPHYDPNYGSDERKHKSKAKRHAVKEDENNDQMFPARPDIFILPGNGKGDFGDSENPHYDPNYGSDERKHKSKAKRHAVKEDENNDQMFPARPDIFILPGNGKGDFGDSENPHYDPNYGSDERKHKSKAKRHAVKEDENNDQMFPARPDIFILPGNGKGDFGDSENPHYDPNYGSDERKHKSKAKRHAVKEDENNDQMFPARPDIFILPGNGKGDFGDSENPHYDPNYGSDERKHKSKAKRHAVKEDENNDQMFPARPDIFILPGNGKGDFGDSENPHYDPNYGSDERKHKSKAKRHAVKEDENNDQMFPARPDIFILPGNGKGDFGDSENPHYDPNYGSDERKHKSKAKRHAVKEDENNDQMFPARPDIFILPGNGKGDFGDSENPHYDPNYGSDERKHKSKAKRHAVKEDENNDQMFPARPDIFILPGNGKGDFGDSENPHYDPNYGSDERKHKSKAKRHAVKEDENNDQMFPARPDIFILPGNGKGDFGDSENPHYDSNYGSDERKHKSKAKRHAVKEDENNDQMFPARPDIFILPGNGKGDFGDSENPHYNPSPEMKAVRVKITTHKKH